MMRRTAARLAVAAAILAVAGQPAAAQRSQPVEGGGSFNDAPIVTPGRFSDTIRPRERLYYAVEVLEGQKLNVRAIIDGNLPVERGPIRTELRMIDPNRDEIPGQAYLHQVWGPSKTRLPLTGDVVGESPFFAEAGLYYVSLSLGRGPRTQFDVDLKFTLKGTPVEPEPTESPASIAEETPEEEPTEEPEPEETEEPPADRGSAAPPASGDDELPVGVFVGFFAAGALGGSAIELFRGGRARRA